MLRPLGEILDSWAALPGLDANRDVLISTIIGGWSTLSIWPTVVEVRDSFVAPRSLEVRPALRVMRLEVFFQQRLGPGIYFVRWDRSDDPIEAQLWYARLIHEFLKPAGDAVY